MGILFACLRPKSLTELMQALGASSRAQFRPNYTEPLIHRGLLALTLPDIPRSPNQRYCTTERGRVLLGGG